MEIRALSPALGAEVSGLRLDRPLGAEEVRELYAAWLKFPGAGVP
jgi:alpha-ketoglutarate-dependent taurine dioxygenase